MGPPGQMGSSEAVTRSGVICPGRVTSRAAGTTGLVLHATSETRAVKRAGCPGRSTTWCDVPVWLEVTARRRPLEPVAVRRGQPVMSHRLVWVAVIRKSASREPAVPWPEVWVTSRSLLRHAVDDALDGSPAAVGPGVIVVLSGAGPVLGLFVVGAERL